MRARTRALALATVAAFVASACLGSGDVPSGAPTIGASPEAGPTVTTYPLHATVVYAGLTLKLDIATATLDARGGSVVVEARMENPLPDAAALDAPIRLTAGGEGYDLRRGTELPEIPAGESSDVVLTFDVLGRSSVDDAVIRVGASEDHQALVPLVPGPVPLVTLEPVTVAATGSAAGGELAIALQGAVLRWDLPDWGTELPVGSEALTLTYDVTFTGSFVGGFPFTGDNVALRLPDGTLLDPRKDGHSQSIEVIGAGKTVTGLSSRFEIPAGTRGTFALIVKNDTARGTIEFSVPG